MSISPPRWQCCPLPDAGWLLPSPAPLGRARPYQPLWLLVLLPPSSHHCTSTTPGEVIPYPGQSTWQIIFPATKQRKLRCWANCPTMTRHYSRHWLLAAGAGPPRYGRHRNYSHGSLSAHQQPDTCSLEISAVY